ncbi:MAG: hypothetical protein ACUVT7_01020 [Thermoplasmata archaeon]
MADEEKREAYHDYSLAAMYRMDPDRLAALRRAVSGMTRCPDCDATNPADQKRCVKCGAYLYPDLEEEEKEEEGD